MVEGNIVGLDAAGTADQGNLLAGILLDGVLSNSVGGDETGAGNVLSNNGTAGLVIDGGSSNTLQGNRIGTDPTGTSALGNLQNGLVIIGSSGNTIGGTAGPAANIVSGNSLSGISISMPPRVIRCWATGSAPILLAPWPGKWPGWSTDHSALSNTIGGAAAGAGNLISANRSHGVEISGTATDPAEAERHRREPHRHNRQRLGRTGKRPGRRFPRQRVHL